MQGYLPFEALLKGESWEAKVRSNRITFDEVNHSIYNIIANPLLTLWLCVYALRMHLGLEASQAKHLRILVHTLDDVSILLSSQPAVLPVEAQRPILVSE